VSDPLLGSRIGNYRLDAELGHGGMGVVYRAEDLALTRPVALKLLAPRLLEDATARARFQQEIRNAVAIEHPHVVPIYSAGYEDGYFFLAMRLVHGPDLGRLVREGGPLPERRALRLIGQIASALDAVHDRGIVHRDIKPQNVLVWNADHPDEHVFLTDFGIAKALDETVGLTRGGALGTPGYMAPELLGGQKPTPLCDQYSLACLAYEVLSGHLPFEGEPADAELILPIPLGVHAPGLSKRVCDTIHRALSVDPQKRFANVRAFVMTDETATQAFEEAREVTETVNRAHTQLQLVSGLYTRNGLSEPRIAEIADLKRAEVVRLRRSIARRSIVGE
jgi:serine/threonine protein kinase